VGTEIWGRHKRKTQDLQEQRRARYLAIVNVVLLLAGAFVATTGFLLSPVGLE